MSMKKKDIIEMLIKNVEKRSMTRIARDKIDLNAIDGIPLGVGKKLLLLQYLYDFQFDGYKIIRLKDITFVRSDEVEMFHEFILKEEGIYDQIKMPQITNVDSWGETVKELAALNKNIIVECESIEDNDKFFLGKITDSDGKSISIHCFDACGQWDEEPSRIDFNEITCTSFNDRYTEILSKYVK